MPGLDDGTIQQAITEAFSSPEVSDAIQQYGDAITSTQTDAWARDVAGEVTVTFAAAPAASAIATLITNLVITLAM